MAINDLNAIPCLLFRGGTSKGPFLLKEDLPAERQHRHEVLLKIMGSPDAKQINGIGGGQFVTSKEAIVEKSAIDGVDVNYYFAQVMLDEAKVDDSPTCGNMLSAVGAFAIEKGLAPIRGEKTEVVVADMNTGARVKQVLPTPHGKLVYTGDHAIAGVPGTAAEVELQFENIAGGKTGSYLPTKNARDQFNGVEATCLDISMPTVFFKASDFAIRGDESPEQLSNNVGVIEKIMHWRELASQAMGMGSSEGKVVPKVALISAARNGGDFTVRYFTPKSCHPSVAVSAGFCMAAGCFVEGSILHEFHPMPLPSNNSGKADETFTINIENPAGITPVALSFPQSTMESVTGKTLRTCRLLFSGMVYF